MQALLPSPSLSLIQNTHTQTHTHTHTLDDYYVYGKAPLGYYWDKDPDGGPMQVLFSSRTGRPVDPANVDRVVRITR